MAKHRFSIGVLREIALYSKYVDKGMREQSGFICVVNPLHQSFIGLQNCRVVTVPLCLLPTSNQEGNPMDFTFKI